MGRRPLKIICTRCGKLMHDGEPPVSYGMCDQCFKEVIPKDLKKMGDKKDGKV